MNTKLSASTRRELAALRLHWKALVMLCASVILFYVLSITVKPGLFTTAMSAVALLFMCVTCLMRLNDIDTSKRCRRWNMRRLGFVLVGLGAVTLLFSDAAPTWREVFLQWGVMFVWLTTPGMPPWWKWVWGLEYVEDYDGPERRRERL